MCLQCFRLCLTMCASRVLCCRQIVCVGVLYVQAQASFVYVHVIYVYALAYFACAQVLYVVREDLTLSPIVCLPSYTLSHGLQPVC